MKICLPHLTSLIDRLDPKADYEYRNTPTLDTTTQSSPENKRTQQSVPTPIASENKTTSENASIASLQPESERTSTSSASNAAELEDEASSEGAFNPATGEINWDCPCLGGMAHGPCGEEFRAAFSCFVFSEDEPKGMDCIDRFKGMQECFRAHPDVYAAELEGDDDEQLDEGLEEEEKELVKEIKERRGKAESAAANPVQGKRLLDDDPPMERKPLLRRSEPQPQTPGPSASTPPSSSSERHPSMSEDHEADARMKRKPISTKVQPESNPDKTAKTELLDEDPKGIPNERHVRRSGSVPNKQTEK